MSAPAVPVQNLRQRVVRGGLAKLCSQGINALLRIASLVFLARLLAPGDFGLIAMAMTVVGVLNLFRDVGLTTATVQQATVSQKQLSTLFWINVLVGVLLTAFTMACAPVLASFFHEPRLVPVTVAIAGAFLANAMGMQHAAVLQRQVRFTALATIETLSLLASLIVGVVMALLGTGYWSLVGMTLAAPIMQSVGVWLATGWVPGRPCRDAGVSAMVRTGGTVLINSVVVYAAYNVDKVLLGRFWGAEALGIYGRAYQLINIPTENLNSAVGPVAVSALSRVKEDPVRLRSHFLRMYEVLIGITLPITAACALFAHEIVLLMLGPKWLEAAPIFRLLTPSMLVFGMINPMWPLLLAHDRLRRSVMLSFCIAPLAIASYAVGLHWGPSGVATASSVAMSVWLVPHLALCVHGTVVSLKDIAVSVGRPLLSALVAAAVAGSVTFGTLASALPYVRLAVGVPLMIAVYLGMLLWVMGQHRLYGALLRDLGGRAAA